MNRAQVLKAIQAAGIANDQQAFLRLYTENRVALAIAREAFDTGRRMAKSFASRADA